MNIQVISKILWIVALSVTLGCQKMKPNHEPLTFVFPHIHYNYNWDVATSGSLWKYFITDNLVEPMVRLGGKSQYNPAIASSWQFSSDKLSLRLEIKEGHQFHDGTPIKAEDVLESFKRVLKLKKTSHSDLSEAICTDNKDSCSGLSLEGNIISLKLNKVVNGLLFNLASPEYGLTPKGYGKEDDTYKKDLFNLSGPYRVKSFSEKELKLSKVAGHYLNSERSVEDVVIKEITSFDESVAYYNEHKGTVLVGSDYSSGVKLSKLEGKKYISAPSLTEFFLPNIDSKKLDSIEKRKKVFSLINRAKENISIDENLGIKTNQIFIRDSLARLDEKKVSELYKDQVRDRQTYKVLVFDWMADTPIVPKIKEELRKLRVTLEIENTPITKVKEVLEKRNYDLIYLYSGVSAYDPIIEFIYLFNHPLTAFGYKNDKALSLLNDCKERADKKSYKEGLQELHLSLLEEYRVLPIIHTKMIYLTNSQYSLDSLNHFNGGLNLWEWVIDDK